MNTATIIARIPPRLKQIIRRIAARHNVSDAEMLRRFLWSQVLLEDRRRDK